jgi:hypothetical protein
MLHEQAHAPVSKVRYWVGMVLSVLPALFLILDAVMKIVKPQPVLDATAKLGYPESSLVPMAIVLMVSTVLYLIPHSAVIGAILLTGYLGGAVASHVRISDPVFDTSFAIIFGIVLWTGLALRNEKLRQILLGQD